MQARDHALAQLGEVKKQQPAADKIAQIEEAHRQQLEAAQAQRQTALQERDEAIGRAQEFAEKQKAEMGALTKKQTEAVRASW